jgi:hypothetical protein
MQALILPGALILAACHGAEPAMEDPVETRKQREVEIARLEEQVKSYDLLDSIVAGAEGPADKEAIAKRQEIDKRLAQLRAQVDR